ncbi:MAG: hypothetical protein WCZ18_13015 [Ottowia sp.]|nr:hypothetical protein [Ottowia sp.]
MNIDSSFHQAKGQAAGRCPVFFIALSMSFPQRAAHAASATRRQWADEDEKRCPLPA